MDSSTDEDESQDNATRKRREDLKKRLEQFRNRKSVNSEVSFSRCSQLLLPEDYNKYMDLEANFIRHGFSVIKGNLDTGIEIPCLQWCSHRSVAWELVFRGDLVCNHYYMRSGLIRKAELCDIVSAYAPACLPETHTSLFDSRRDRLAFINRVEKLCQSDIWILKVITP